MPRIWISLFSSALIKVKKILFLFSPTLFGDADRVVTRGLPHLSQCLPHVDQDNSECQEHQGHPGHGLKGHLVQVPPAVGFLGLELKIGPAVAADFFVHARLVAFGANHHKARLPYFVMTWFTAFFHPSQRSPRFFFPIPGEKIRRSEERRVGKECRSRWS